MDKTGQEQENRGKEALNKDKRIKDETLGSWVMSTPVLSDEIRHLKHSTWKTVSTR